MATARTDNRPDTPRKHVGRDLQVAVRVIASSLISSAAKQAHTVEEGLCDKPGHPTAYTSLRPRHVVDSSGPPLRALSHNLVITGVHGDYSTSSVLASLLPDAQMREGVRFKSFGFDTAPPVRVVSFPTPARRKQAYAAIVNNEQALQLYDITWGNIRTEFRSPVGLPRPDELFDSLAKCDTLQLEVNTAIAVASLNSNNPRSCDNAVTSAAHRLLHRLQTSSSSLDTAGGGVSLAPLTQDSPSADSGQNDLSADSASHSDVGYGNVDDTFTDVPADHPVAPPVPPTKMATDAQQWRTSSKRPKPAKHPQEVARQIVTLRTARAAKAAITTAPAQRTLPTTTPVPTGTSAHTIPLYAPGKPVPVQIRELIRIAIAHDQSGRQQTSVTTSNGLTCSVTSLLPPNCVSGEYEFVMQDPQLQYRLLQAVDTPKLRRIFHSDRFESVTGTVQFSVVVHGYKCIVVRDPPGYARPPSTHVHQAPPDWYLATFRAPVADPPDATSSAIQQHVQASRQREQWPPHPDQHPIIWFWKPIILFALSPSTPIPSGLASHFTHFIHVVDGLRRDFARRGITTDDIAKLDEFGDDVVHVLCLSGCQSFPGTLSGHAAELLHERGPSKLAKDLCDLAVQYASTGMRLQSDPGSTAHPALASPLLH